MADITAAMVKDLREKTGVGMMDCKAALAATNGDMEAAMDWLRTKGLALAATYTGCRSFKALRCVEYPDTIMFLAEWDSIEAHQASRHEVAHVQFRELLLPYAAGARETVHFTGI